jgi:outer membrane protein assembly factor BamB
MAMVSEDLVAVFNTGYGKPDLEAYQLTADAQGDLTKSHYLWTQSRGAPKRSSPVIADGLLYMANDGGVATCVDMKTGEIYWSERLGDAQTGSPVYADGLVFFFGEDGESTALKPGREFVVVSKNKLEDGMMASPAVAGDQWYLRGKNFLYRIEK